MEKAIKRMHMYITTDSYRFININHQTFDRFDGYDRIFACELQFGLMK